METLTFENFDNIRVSTITIICTTNISLYLKELYDYITPKEIHIPTTIKKKKNILTFLKDLNLKDGTIISVEFEKYKKGLFFKKKKQEFKKAFRNNVSIGMMINNKPINFKVPTKGKFQITGCSNINHAIECVKYFWIFLQNNKNLYVLNGDYFSGYFKIVMTNIGFNLGTYIDRAKLNQYINQYTDFNSLLETDFGYPGVNVKKRFDPKNVKIDYIEYKDEKWNLSSLPYCEYIKLLPRAETLKEEKKNRNNTFLVFYNGTVIMSGMTLSLMRDAYYEFIGIVEEFLKKSFMESVK